MTTRLTQIQIRGLKGSTGAPVQLDQVTFLRGPNAAGKSTVLDGVALLVLGYHPTANRGGTPAIRNDDVLRLASGDLLEVAGAFDVDGKIWTFTRRWERAEVRRGKDKGDLKTTTSLQAVDPRNRQLAGEDAKAELRRIVGEAWGLDLGQLLGSDVTDSKRRAMLLDAGGRRSTWTPARVHSSLDELGLLGCLLGDPWQGSGDDGPLADWLTSQWEHAKEETSLARALVATTREAVAGLQDNSGAPIDPAHVGELRKQQAQAQTTAQQIEGRTARVEEQAQQELDRALEGQERHNRQLGELDQVRAELAQVSQAVPNTDGLKAALEDLEEGFGDDSLPSLQGAVRWAQSTLDAAEQAEQRLQTGNTSLSQELQQAVKGAEQKWQAALLQVQQTGLSAARATQQELTLGLRSARQFLESNVQMETSGLRKELQELERTIAQDPIVLKIKEALEWEEFCPACGEKLVSLLSELNLDLDVTQRIELLRLDLAGAEQAERAREETRISELQRDLDETTQEIASLEAKDQQLQQLARAAERELQETRARAAREQQVQGQEQQHAAESVRTARAALSRAQEALQQAQGRLADLQAQLVQAEAGSGQVARLATLREREAALVSELTRPVPDVGALRQACEHTRQQGKRDREQANAAAAEALLGLRTAEERRALHVLKADLQVKLDQAEKDFDERLRIEAALGPKGLMGQVILEILSPLTEAVNGCLATLQLGEFQVQMFDARSAPVCRPGLVRAGSFSPVETLSDGERAAVHAALLVGVANLGASPWRLLQADALERIDQGRREAFLLQVVELVRSGQADQAILAGCPDSLPAVNGVTVLEVRRQSPEQSEFRKAA